MWMPVRAASTVPIRVAVTPAAWNAAATRAAAEALQALPAGAVHACTDITGFGLIGHASEIAKGSGVTLSINAAQVPVFTGVLSIAAANRSGGLGSNEDHFAAGVAVDPGVDADREAILYDPQTSGGLLVAANAESADEVRAALIAAGVDAVRIGWVGAGRPGTQVVVQA